MNLLLETIQSLNKEETRYYKVFTKKTHKQETRKDLTLFNSIKKTTGDYNEKEISKTLYGNKKNNFYQLKNKLIKSINKSLVAQYSSKDKESAIQNNILISKIYKRKGLIKISYHYLKLAEKEAIKIESFELLSVIYTDILKLSYDLVSIDIQKYITKKTENKTNLSLAQDIEITLSSVMYKIKTTQNFSTEKDEIAKKLNTIIHSISSKTDISKSKKFRIKLFQAISRVLLQKNDFLSLEAYIKKTYHDFLKDKIFSKTNHEQKLMMLTYLTNSLYKNNKLKESLLVAEQLNKAMHEFDSLLKRKFLFYYYNSLVINYSKLDKNKAINVLKEARKNKTIQEIPTFGSFIYLNMGLLYYDQKKYKSAIRNISRLILQKDFITLSKHFQLKILISELIIRHNLNQTDLIEEKIKFIKKKYRKTLDKSDRDKGILVVIKDLIYCTNIYTDKKIQKKMKNLKDMLPNKIAENIDVINYNEWIDKISQQSNRNS